MLLAYPSETSKLAEHLARDAFLNSLGDEEPELKVREREIDTLEEALRVTQHFEIVKNAVAPQHRLRYSRQVSDKKEAMDEHELQTLKSRLAALESGMRSARTGTSPSVRGEGRFEECTNRVQRTAFYGIWECPARRKLT